MKFNKWTLGLAAVGAVSMASAVRADEAKLSQVQTALSNVTISGYVDVQAEFTAGNQLYRNSYQYSDGGYYYNINQDNRDQFQLNTVTISLDKPQDESPWATGYHVDLNAGSAAIHGVSLGNQYYGEGYDTIPSDPNTVALRQAYIALRTPVGNGIDWKVGVMDGITGFEGNTAYQNPNITRSFAYAINPASYTGLLGSYKVSSLLSLTAGMINRTDSQYAYGQNNWNLSAHDYVASVTLTAPDSFGFLKGSTLNLQTVQGFDNEAVNNYSVNGTLNTPVAGFKLGFAWDALQSLAYSADGNIYGLYATYQATDKLNLALRGEYIDTTDLASSVPNSFVGWNNYLQAIYGKGEEITATAEYNLWANVVTRAEIRWDHQEQGTTFETAGSNTANQFSLVINAVYKF
jgi:Putative beta-barrel porin-2, OmpL-like. bbp2